MLLTYRLTTFALALCVSAVIFFLVRRSRLHASYAIWWLSGAGLALVFGCFPASFDAIGHFLGVTYPPILFLLLLLVILGIRMLLADIDRTQLELTQRALIQHYAELAQRVRMLEAQVRSHNAEPLEDANAQCPQDAGDQASPRGQH